MNILPALILSGAASVDRNAAFHVMISRPIVIAAIVGLCYGNIQTTFLIGIFVELVGIIDVPVGTRSPKDDSFLAYVLSMINSFGYFDSVYAFFILTILALWMVSPVTYTDVILRKFNQRLFLSALEKGEVNSFSLISTGIFAAFLRGLLVYNLFLLILISILQYISSHLAVTDKMYIYIMFLIIFASGYFLRFLSYKNSIIKYTFFAAGIVIGWMLI